MKKVRFSVGVAALLALSASTAMAAPTISGVDGTVYGPTGVPANAYTLGGTGPFAWTIAGVAGVGPSVPSAAFVPPATGTYSIVATDATPLFSVRTFVFDQDLPTTPVLAPPATPTNDTTPALDWSDANGTGSLVANHQVRVNGALRTTGSAASAWDVTPALADGLYTLEVRAIDQAGNVGAFSGSQPIRIDTADPSIPALAAPANNAVTSDRTPSFSWLASSDVSGIDAYIFRIERASGGSQQTVETAVTSTTVPTPLTDGTYVWKVRTRDNAGNVSAFSAERTVVIDTNGPAAPTLVQTAGALTRDATPAFKWSGEAGARFRYTVRNVAGTILQEGNTGTTASVTLAELPGDGGYGFEVFQIDAANNEGPGAQSNFTLDATPPGRPSLTTLPKSPSVSPDPVFGWAAGETGASFTWQVIDSKGGGIATGSTDKLSARPTKLPAGTHIFRLWQVDPAGNASTPAEAIFTITNPKEAVRQPTVTTVRPKTRFASRVLPKAGKGISTATANLKWRKSDKRTILYNVQVFRMDGKTLTKVHSAFPRGVRYSVPARFLKANNRYVWQVWEYLGAEDGYLPKPSAISFFDKLKTKVPSTILAPKGNHKAGKKLVVNWRSAKGSKYYEFQFFQGRKRIIKQVIDGTSYTLTANLLKPGNTKYRVVIKRSIGNKKKFVAKAWGGKSFKVVSPAKK